MNNASNWIDVLDRNPSREDEYLVFADEFCFIAYYEPDDARWIYEGNRYRIPSFWQPLPPTPTPATGEWINAKTPPESFGEYLVFAGGILIADYEPDVDEWTYEGVRYWQPLPPDPEPRKL